MVRAISTPFVAAALAVALSPGPVFAATEADCQAAIDAVEKAMRDDAVLEAAPESRRERIESILAEAGEAGLQGDYERCLERVDAAKGIAGLS